MEERKIIQTSKKSRDASLFDQSTTHICPECKEKLMIRSGKSGAFWGCTSYPDCHYHRPLKKPIEDPILAHLDGQNCPVCGDIQVLKQGRFGLFIGCSQYPQCLYTDVLEHPDETHFSCPECKKGKLILRRSRFGKKFHGCNGYPDCRFAVNFTPVAGKCDSCHFPLLIEKNTSRGKLFFCANKRCGIENDCSKPGK